MFKVACCCSAAEWFSLCGEVFKPGWYPANWIKTFMLISGFISSFHSDIKSFCWRFLFLKYQRNLHSFKIYFSIHILLSRNQKVKMKNLKKFYSFYITFSDEINVIYVTSHMEKGYRRCYVHLILRMKGELFFF